MDITLKLTWVDMITASMASDTATTMGTPMLLTVGLTSKVKMCPKPSRGITKIRAWATNCFLQMSALSPNNGKNGKMSPSPLSNVFGRGQPLSLLFASVWELQSGLKKKVKMIILVENSLRKISEVETFLHNIHGHNRREFLTKMTQMRKRVLKTKITSIGTWSTMVNLLCCNRSHNLAFSCIFASPM